MIDRLGPYPTCKPSSIKWLGDVPEHWEVLPNRAIFAEVNERNCPEEHMLSVTIANGVIRQQELLEDTSKKDGSRLDRVAYKLVQPGDIAYNKMRAWQGAVGVSKYRGIISPAYVVQRPRKGTNSRYLHHLMRTPAFSLEAERWSYGITSDMWSLRPEHFKMIYACVPPLPEQTAIVRYLDHADRRIQRYISGKQKLIKLLEDQKQAIIHRAVTRGLDPNVRLKPSGVEWLGEVPEHWEVRRLRYLVKGKLTYGANAAAEYADPDWPRYLRITDFDQDGVLKNNTFRSLPPEVARDYLVQPGDLLLARSGATVGKAFLVLEDAGEACYAGYLIRARPHRALIEPHFLFAFTQSTGFTWWKNSTFILSTIQNISAQKYADLHVPCPPLSEQAQIISCLAKATFGTDSVISRSRRQIGLLQEYRTRLIADVVTGKLDVRDVEIPASGEEPAFDGTDGLEEETESDEADVMEEVYGGD